MVVNYVVANTVRYTIFGETPANPPAPVVSAPAS